MKRDSFQIIKRMKAVLGTYVEIAVLGSRLSEEATHCRIDKAFKQIDLVHRLMSFHDPESDLSKINRSYGTWVDVHSHTYHVLKLAQRLMQQSHGAFDFTVGATLMKAGALPHFGYSLGDYALCADAENAVELQNNQVKLNQKVALTLDGIAKGYALDLAMAMFCKRLFQSVWINAGGDIKVQGVLEFPVYQRQSNGSLVQIQSIANAAIASSYVKKRVSKKYPAYCVAPVDTLYKTGMYTVSAKYAWLADALTKVAAFAQAEICQKVFSVYGATVLCRP